MEEKNRIIRSRQQELLACFKDISVACDSLGVKLFLQGGTLLGKVRHNGFIPWDDDMDFGMSREDYNKLIALFDSTELAENYEMRAPGYAKGAVTRFLQIYRKRDIEGIVPKKDAVWLDIFPIDNVPDSRFVRRIKGIRINALELIAGSIEFMETYDEETVKRLKASFSGRVNYFLRAVVAFVFGRKKRQKYYTKIDKVIQCKKEGAYCSSATGRWHYFGEMQKTSVFFPQKRTEFCGTECWTVNQEQEYLLHNYGANYMVIPPEKARESHI